MESIDNFTTSFVNIIDRGFGFVQGDVYFLTEFLIILNIIFLGMLWSFGDNSHQARVWFLRILSIGFWVFLIENYQNITEIVLESAALYGLTAGGSNLTVSQLFQPSNILNAGYTAAEPLFTEITNTSLWSLWNPSTVIKIVIIFIACMLLLFAFFYLAIQMFVGLVEFKLLSLASFILVPFSLFYQTRGLADKAINSLIAASLKVCILALVIGIGGSLFSSLVATNTTIENISFEEILSLIAGSYIIVALARAIPNLANSLIWGGVSLSAEGHVNNTIYATKRLGGGGVSAASGLWGLYSNRTSSRRASNSSGTRVVKGGDVHPHGNVFAPTDTNTKAPGSLTDLDGGKKD